MYRNWDSYVEADLKILLGQIVTKIERDKEDDELKFTLENGDEYILYHSQDCCETVRIEDIIGNLDDLIGSPITLADVATNREGPKPDEYSESFTWTFYKFATIKGYVDIRWLGESNGYYGEEVDFVKLKNSAQTQQT